MGKKNPAKGPAAAANGGSKRPKLSVPSHDGDLAPGMKQPLPTSAKPTKSALKGGRKAAEEGGAAGVNGVVVGNKVEEVAAKAKSKGADALKGDATGTQSGPSVVGKKQKQRLGKGKGKATISTPAAEVKEEPYTSLKLVFGTYERILYGLHCSFEEATISASPGGASLTPLFSFPAHSSALRTATSSPSGKYLLTSCAASSALSLWALRTRKEAGSLIGPNENASVTAVEFDRQGKIVCVANEEGEVVVYRTKDWVMLRRLKGHTGRINGIGIHPDGRVMMTVGKDRCLRMWDLGGGKVEGSKSKPVASVRLGVEGDLVKWSDDGKRFAVVTGGTVTVYDTAMKPLTTVKSPRGRAHDIAFHVVNSAASTAPSQTNNEHLFVACDDGIVRAFDLAKVDTAEGVESTLPCVLELRGHSNRVKAVSLIDLVRAVPLNHHGRRATIATTISSDGFAHVYDLSLTSDDSNGPSVLEPVARYDSKGCRPTCLCVVGVTEAEGKRLRAGEEVESTVVGDKRKRRLDDDNESVVDSELESDEDEDDDAFAVGELEDEEAFDDEEEMDGVDLDANGNPLDLGSLDEDEEDEEAEVEDDEDAEADFFADRA